MNHKINQRSKSASAFFSMLYSLFFGVALTACSDVDLPASASDSKSTVSELAANVPEGTRQVTLSWNNPAGDIVGIQIIKDNTDITELEGAPTSYVIKKAPTNVEIFLCGRMVR